MLRVTGTSSPTSSNATSSHQTRPSPVRMNPIRMVAPRPAHLVELHHVVQGVIDAEPESCPVGDVSGLEHGGQTYPHASVGICLEQLGDRRELLGTGAGLDEGTGATAVENLRVNAEFIVLRPRLCHVPARRQSVIASDVRGARLELREDLCCLGFCTLRLCFQVIVKMDNVTVSPGRRRSDGVRTPLPRDHRRRQCPHRRDQPVPPHLQHPPPHQALDDRTPRQAYLTSRESRPDRDPLMDDRTGGYWRLR